MLTTISESPDTRRKTDDLLTLLKATPVSGIATYEAMGHLLQEPVTSQHPALRAALDRAAGLRIIFENVREVGYRRLPDREIATSDASRSLRKIYRSAKRGLRRLVGIRDYEALSMHERASLNAKRSAMEIIKTRAHGNSINSQVEKQESALEREQRRLAEAARSRRERPAEKPAEGPFSPPA